MSNEFDELITQGQRGLVLITDEEFICEALWFTEGLFCYWQVTLGLFSFDELKKQHFLKGKLFYQCYEYSEVISDRVLSFKPSLYIIIFL